ncbi:1026_t:CDS:1, partial [Scutellospora calospora]
ALKLDFHVDNVYKKHFQSAITGQKSEDLDYSKFFVEHLKGQPQFPSVSNREDYINGNKEDVKKMDRNEFRSIPQQSDSIKQDDKDPLTFLIDSFRDMQLTFEPLIPYKPVYIAKLPNESIVCILEKLVMVGDVTSLERFGLVCKKFLLLSREPSLWKYLCEKAYRYRNLECNESNKLLAKDVELLYANDWRR